MSKKNYRLMRKVLRPMLSLFIVLVMTFGGFPQGILTLKVLAYENAAQVYTLHLDAADEFLTDDEAMPSTAAISQCEISDVPEGRVPIGLFVSGGNYSISAEDLACIRILILNNADLTVPESVDLTDVDIIAALWGSSKIVASGYDLVYNGDAYSSEPTETEVSADAVGLFLAAMENEDFSNNASIVFTADLDGNSIGFFNLAPNVVIPEGRSITLSTNDYGYSSMIVCANLTVGGSLTIPSAAENAEPNGLQIWENGNLTVTGTLTAGDGAVLDLEPFVTITGVDLYEPDGTTPFVCDGTNNDQRECFNYDADEGKWIKSDGGGGPQIEDWVVEQDETINCYYRAGNVVVNENVTLSIPTGHDDQNHAFSSMLEADSLEINGTVSIEEATDECGPNAIRICDNGSLTIGSNGSLVAADGAVLELAPLVTVSGITLYENDGETELVCDGTNNDATEVFCYDEYLGLWKREGGGGPGGDWTVDQDAVINHPERFPGVIINEGVTLTIQTGFDDGRQEYDGSALHVDFIDINGTLVIEAASNGCTVPNVLKVENDGRLIIGENGGLTAGDGAVLDIGSRVTVSGITLYDSNGTDVFLCDGSNESGEVFNYDASENKWIRGDAGGQGNVSDLIVDADMEESFGRFENIVVNSGCTLSIPTGYDDQGQRYVGARIQADNITVNGTISIEAPSNGCSDPNALVISEDGRLTVNQDGALNAADGSVLEVGARATVTGVTLYDSNGTDVFVCNENNTNSEVFNYDATSGKWIRGNGGGGSSEVFIIKIPSALDPNSHPSAGYIRVEGDIDSSGASQDYMEYRFLLADYDSVRVTVGLNPNSTFSISSVTVDGVLDSTLTPSEKKTYKVYTLDSCPEALAVIEYNATFEMDMDDMLDEIEGHEYAYYPGNRAGVLGSDAEQIAQVKDYLATEIWFEYFEGDRPFAALDIYDDLDDLKDNLSATEISQAVANDPAGIENGLKYINFTMTAGSNSNVIKVYLLQTRLDFILEQGGGRKYNIITANDDGSDMVACIELQVENGREEGVYVFGNGSCTVGNLNTEDDTYVIGWHITQEHSGLGGYTENHQTGEITGYDYPIGGLNGRLALCKDLANTSYVKVVGSESAGGWDFADLEWFGANGDSGNPGVATVFLASSSVDIENVNFTNTDGEDVGVLSVALDTTVLSEDAVTITQNGSKFTVTFNTQYDEIPLILTMTDNSTRYITIRRVALYLDDNNFSNGKIDVFHSTSAVSYNVMSTDHGKAIYATYYYTTGDREPNASERVNLFVTITTSGGTTKKEISNAEAITFDSSAYPPSWCYDPQWDPAFVKGYIGENHLTNHYYDDFILWEGTEEEFAQIVSVEAIAFEVGDDNTFGGVKVGSGSGTKWVHQSFGS